MQRKIIILALVSIFFIIETKADFLLSEYGSLGSKADFYDEEFLQGSSTHIETAGPCKNLPVRWRNKAMSVDTLGTCFSACDDLDCGGNCKRVYPANGEQQLKTIGLDLKIVSIQGCFNKKKGTAQSQQSEPVKVKAPTGNRRGAPVPPPRQQEEEDEA